MTCNDKKKKKKREKKKKENWLAVPSTTQDHIRTKKGEAKLKKKKLFVFNAPRSATMVTTLMQGKPPHLLTHK